MKRFYVMDFGEDLVIHYDTQDKEQTPLYINEAARLLNEQQEEIRKLKFQLCEKPSYERLGGGNIII